MKVRVHYHSGTAFEFVVPSDISLEAFIILANARGGKIRSVEFL